MTVRSCYGARDRRDFPSLCYVVFSGMVLEIGRYNNIGYLSDQRRDDDGSGLPDTWCTKWWAILVDLSCGEATHNGPAAVH